MGHPGELLLHRRQHDRVRVAQDQRPVADAEIDEPIPIDVPLIGAARAIDVDRRWFDPSDIESRLDTILAQCASWRKYFAMHQIEPLEVCYEDLIASPASTCEELLDFCGVDSSAPMTLEAAGVRRQADQLTQEWRERMISHWRTQRGR